MPVAMPPVYLHPFILPLGGKHCVGTVAVSFLPPEQFFSAFWDLNAIVSVTPDGE